MARAACDLHVHSTFSTDSGSFALRRARLGESYTAPARVYDVARRRGMRFVTITDHNTVEGALRIAHLPDTFLSEEVTTRFPEDDVVLHVLVWNLTEEDHRDLQPYRDSVYELQAFLAERGLRHALAHPLYRMGPPLTPSHVERMMLLFGVWEGRNGARPRRHNELASALAGVVTPALLARLAERHDLEPRHPGGIALVGGSDDHGALDIATTWTEASGASASAFLDAACAGRGAPVGAHGSPEKLAHAIVALFVNAYRAEGAAVPAPFDDLVRRLFDEDALNVAERHDEISLAISTMVRSLAEQARSGGMGLGALQQAGGRLTQLVLAGLLQAPFLATAHHQSGGRGELDAIRDAFLPAATPSRRRRALLFTDTFAETNGVAGTMRRIDAVSELDGWELRVVTSATTPSGSRVLNLPPDWAFPLPTSEHIELGWPNLLDVVKRVHAEAPDVIQVATPGPVGLSGLLAAKTLEIPVVGAYHTELGPYALHLTGDLVAAEVTRVYVDWFYRQCDRVLAPTAVVGSALVERGVTDAIRLWGRGVDAERFSPRRRTAETRERLLQGGDLVALSVGRLSPEKRVDVLLDAFHRASEQRPGLRLAIVGEGPARGDLEARAGTAVTFLGEVRGHELAEVYASADVFCFPSTTDTFGQVLLEAGASGLPVVAAAVGGALEIVRAGVSGLLVEPDDPEALAAVLLELAESPGARRRLGAGGREVALGRTWDDAMRQLVETYAELAGREGRRDVRDGRLAA